MRITTTALCLLAALVASGSTEAKTIKLHLRVNVDHDSVTVLKADGVDAVPKRVTFNSGSALNHLNKGYFAPSTRLSKAATMPEGGDDDEEDDDEIRACESVAIQPWVSQLDYACTLGSPTNGYDFLFKLTNGTFFANELCDSSDKAGLDKVFEKAMGGSELTPEDKEFNFKCFSQHHASYAAKDHLEYDSEFDFVADQFAELFEDDEDEDESDE